VDNALTLAMWLVAHVVDERQRRQRNPTLLNLHRPKSFDAALH
jgi:hypothetical protein